jgi:hypothetical protein
MLIFRGVTRVSILYEQPNNMVGKHYYPNYCHSWKTLYNKNLGFALLCTTNDDQLINCAKIELIL